MLPWQRLFLTEASARSILLRGAFVTTTRLGGNLEDACRLSTLTTWLEAFCFARSPYSGFSYERAA